MILNKYYDEKVKFSYLDLESKMPQTDKYVLNNVTTVMAALLLTASYDDLRFRFTI